MASTELNKTTVTSDIFTEFLEVSIHCVLYNRGIYPAGVFERRKKYNVPVQMCLHPDVTAYISKVIESVKAMVASGDVSMVTMVILNPSQIPLERFVFELGNSAGKGRDDRYLFRLEDSLRAFLLKLNCVDAMLKQLPQECSWVVHVHTKESTADTFVHEPTVKDFSWIQADEKHLHLQEPRLLPLKSANDEMLKMQLYVEESAKKNDLQT